MKAVLKLAAAVCAVTSWARVELAFVNHDAIDIEVFWEPPSGGARASVGVVKANSTMKQLTRAGARFSYDVAEEARYIRVEASTQYVIMAEGRRASAVDVVFRNEYESEISLFWEGEERVAVGEMAASGGELVRLTDLNHRFSYAEPVTGATRFVLVESGFVLIAPETVRVVCALRAKPDDEDGDSVALEIDVKPAWAPRGASRFLELVRADYYTDVAAHRHVSRLFSHFGISPDFETREAWRERTIADDPRHGGHPARSPFAPGSLSFAGSGPHSRATSVFLVSADAPFRATRALGVEPWETPFGVATPASLKRASKHLAHDKGDAPPLGEGPDTDKIFSWGYEYLRREFKDLAYVDNCTVVDPTPSLTGKASSKRSAPLTSDEL